MTNLNPCIFKLDGLLPIHGSINENLNESPCLCLKELTCVLLEKILTEVSWILKRRSFLRFLRLHAVFQSEPTSFVWPSYSEKQRRTLTHLISSMAVAGMAGDRHMQERVSVFTSSLRLTGHGEKAKSIMLRFFTRSLWMFAGLYVTFCKSWLQILKLYVICALFLPACRIVYSYTIFIGLLVYMWNILRKVLFF